MGDLEDVFFKHNIPGQYTKWSDDDDQNHDDSSDDSHDDEYYFADCPVLPLSTSTAAPSAAGLGGRKGGNTGVKGVISDYLETRREETLKGAAEKLKRLEILRGTVHPSSRADAAENSNKTIPRDEESSSDDEFVQKFRSRRLEPQHNIASSPTYRTYTAHTPDEYVTLVDTIDPQTHLVVHLYESSMKESAMLHSALEKVAQVMDDVKFIEVVAYDAKPDLDPICLPAILVYRGGELKCNAVRFTDGLIGQRGGGDWLDVEDVREALENLGVGSRRGV